jgi:hypothetical protein
LKAISTDIRQRISAIGYLFVAADGIADHSITAINSTLLKTNGSIWHNFF